MHTYCGHIAGRLRVAAILVMGASTLASWGIASAQVPVGFEIAEVVRHEGTIGARRINECGQIVFNHTPPGDDGDVFLYDNGRFTQISSSGDRPAGSGDINNQGTIVWSGGSPLDDDDFVYMLREGVVTILGRGSGAVRINASNHVVWKRIFDRGCRFTSHVFLKDDAGTRQITDGDLSNQSPMINDAGDIVWTRYDFCRQLWVGEIMLYADGELTRINEYGLQDQGPELNDRGQVVWQTPGFAIMMWEEGVRRIIDEDDREGVFVPVINNSGDVAYNKGGDPWLYQERFGVERYYKLRDEEGTFLRIDINDWGEVVWAVWNDDQSMHYMRRIRTGDSEFDGDIDVDDLARLVDCMTGPMWVERVNPGPEESLCDCRFLDINHDGSVDLRDYALFQENFTE